MRKLKKEDGEDLINLILNRLLYGVEGISFADLGERLSSFIPPSLLL
jgi:hypothetical protein